MADAINLGYERTLEEEEMKTPSLVEESPQIPVKRPKIQTVAIATLKGKELARGGEVFAGSRDLFTQSPYDLGIPEDVLNALPGQPHGLYLVLAGRMAEDGDWVDGLWEIRQRLVIFAVYGAKNLELSEGKVPPRQHILQAYKRVARLEYPDWDFQKGEFTPIMEEVAVPVPGRKGQTRKLWALMTLPKGMSSMTFLTPQNRYNGRRGDHMVLFQEFPWELPQTQSYQIFDVPAMVEDGKLIEVIQSRFEEKLVGPPLVKGRVNPVTCRKAWDVTMTFKKVCDEDSQEVVGTIPVGERIWMQAWKPWRVRNGVHCTGCHGQGHQVNECPLRSYAIPYDQRPPTC